MKYRKIVLMFVLILTGCGGPRAMLNTTFTPETRMAVFPFKSVGDMSSRNHGLFCSATLSRELVLQEKAQVVDNSLTNAKLAELEITSANHLTKSQLRRFAAELGVDVLVIGEFNTWQSENADLSLDAGETNFLLTVHFLDPVTGLVLGVITQERSGDEQSQKILSAMVKAIVAKIKHGKKAEPGKLTTQNKT